MTDDVTPERLKVLSGITTLGDGFVDAVGCTMAEVVSPAMAKDILRRLARHVTPGEWASALAERPDWVGSLEPDPRLRPNTLP